MVGSVQGRGGRALDVEFQDSRLQFPKELERWSVGALMFSGVLNFVVTRSRFLLCAS